MANQVTLANGRIATVTNDNWRDLANEDIAAESARGNASNTTALSVMNAFRELAGEDNTFFTYGPNGAETVRNVPADRVLSNPIVQASDAVYRATPNGVQKIWTDASNIPILAGDRLAAYSKATGLGVVDGAKEIYAKFGELNVTLRYAIIGGAIIAAAAATYAVAKAAK
jgi:hypothetical protein